MPQLAQRKDQIAAPKVRKVANARTPAPVVTGTSTAGSAGRLKPASNKHGKLGSGPEGGAAGGSPVKGRVPEWIPVRSVTVHV